MVHVFGSLLLDSGVLGSRVVREAQPLLKDIEKEGLQGGEHDKSPVVRPRHIHDPGIQQERFCKTIARQVFLTVIMKVVIHSCIQEETMSRQPGLSEWIDLVSTHMPHLSVPQARVLALWSYGIALTRSCGRLTVATFPALLMRQKVATVEPRLYEWCCPAVDNAGAQRQTLDVTTCFAPLLRWIVTLWTG